MAQSTEEKLATLQKWIPDSQIDALLELLIAFDGDLDSIKETIGCKESSDSEFETTPKNSDSVAVGSNFSERNNSSIYQATITKFLPTKSKRKSIDNGDNFVRKRHQIPGKVLHLYDAESVAQYLPCTMHLNVLPSDLANSLLKHLLKESETWVQNASFHLFDREVSSPHSTSFYSMQKDIDKSGEYLDILDLKFREFNEDMIMARRIITDIVNKEITKRGRLEYQNQKDWSPNVAICNKYEGPKQSVGFHSDKLTHLGPHAVIASLSLGVTREFRLKQRLYVTDGSLKDDPDSQAKNRPKLSAGISVHLPHNSLIIMHAGCQEEFKHSLMPAAKGVIDTHPIAGISRINMTFRQYLPEFSKDRIPKCDCKKTMILRTVSNTKYALGQEKYPYEYAWFCGNSYSGEEKCLKYIKPKFDAGNVKAF